MNKTLLFIGFILASFIGQAQFEVVALRNNAVVPDGQNYTFSDSNCGYNDPCNWKFAVRNTSAQAINVRIVIDNMVNSNGTDFQVCFASVCLNSVALNGAYPSQAAVIPAGGINDIGNYFWNKNPAGTTTSMSWTMRFQAFDASDNEVGTPISVTYNYQGTLSLGETAIPSLNVFPTQVTNELNVSVNENVSAQFYDLTGRMVKEVQQISDNEKINISDLSSQVYLVRFNNDQGQVKTVKIIKK